MGWNFEKLTEKELEERNTKESNAFWKYFNGLTDQEEIRLALKIYITLNSANLACFVYQRGKLEHNLDATQRVLLFQIYSRESNLSYLSMLIIQVDPVFIFDVANRIGKILADEDEEIDYELLAKINDTARNQMEQDKKQFNLFV